MIRWIVVGLLNLSVLSINAQLTKVANTTLRLPPQPPVASYAVEKVFGRAFSYPVALAHPRGETNRLFVVDQSGIINVLTNLSASTPTMLTFLDISSRVLLNNEQGLLGLAFHPNYEQNGYFYVFYVTPGTRYNRLSRFKVSATDPNAADPDSETILINQIDDFSNHNGGDLHFGPDGYLYVSLGDEGNGGDYGANSQRIDKDFFSGILRIDVDKRPGNLEPTAHAAITGEYSVPADNPFVGATSFNGVALADPSKVRTEFWAVGLRNPWRFSFDAKTGQLWCADVGQGLYEEVDIIVRGGNYGWNFREGLHGYENKVAPPGFVGIDPVYEYPRANGNTAVIGGVVYRGTRMAQLDGAYVFGDYGSGNVWTLRLDAENQPVVELISSVPRISAFGTHPANGDVLICNMSDGWIRRLVYSSGQTGTPIPPTLAETGAFSDVSTLVPEAGIVPYDLNLPFWSDGAKKSRWFSVSDAGSAFTFNPTNTWLTPTGAVWIKHFEMEMTKGDPASARRLETRFVVRNTDGVYGVTYRWTNNLGAVLVPEEGLDEPLLITEGGTIRTQIWRYPSRSECLTCHNAGAGWALGFNTPQLNRNVTHGAETTNQIIALSRAGYLSNTPGAPETLLAMKKPDDSSVSLESRVRSYLAANCANCHLPGGLAIANFDTRLSTPTAEANLIGGTLVNNFGDPANRTLVINDPDHSMILKRISMRGAGQMPPFGSNVPDAEGMQLLRAFLTEQATATITITAEDKEKGYGAANPALTATYSGFVNGDDASVVSGLSLMTEADSSSPVGTYEIVPSGAVAQNYEIVYVNGTLSVTPAPLVVHADDKNKVYGSVNPPLTASYTGFVNGDTPSSLETPVALSTSATASSPVGTYAITAGGASDLNYAITFANGALTVTKAPLTITVENKSKIYGAANPQLTVTYSGFVSGDGPSVVTGLSLATVADASSPVGAYAITASGATAANYQITYVNGSLSVSPAPLTIRADDKSKIYGASIPTLTATYTGFVNGESPLTLDTQALITTDADQSSQAGTYAIRVSGASDPNYTIAFVEGNLTISKAALIVTADNKSKVYGAPIPALTASYSGFVNGDGEAALSAPPTLTTFATAGSAVGAYEIKVEITADQNYDISAANGTLTVTKAPLIITADSKTKIYGSANPPLTASYSGLVNGDQPTVVNGLEVTTTAATTSPVGEYPITPAGGVAPNYSMVLADGKLSITPAALTIKADDKSKTVGAVNPPLTATYSGFVSGDSVLSLDAPVTLSTAADVMSPEGIYPIVVAGARDLNYVVTFVNGTLTISNLRLGEARIGVNGEAEFTVSGLLPQGIVHVEYSKDLSEWVEWTLPTPITSLPATIRLSRPTPDEDVFYRVWVSP